MKLIKTLTLVALAAWTASCYPEKDRVIDDYDIVGTHLNPNTNLEDLKTFRVADSIIMIYDTTSEAPNYPSEIANVILSNIRQNMIDNGWTEDVVDTPDVYLTSRLWENTTIGAIYYPPYWNPWYPGYYPGYWPGWGGGASYYSYTSGTVTIDMFNLTNFDAAADEIPVDWNVVVNGLVSNSSSNMSRIERGINQAFTQSPYLKK